MAVSARTPENTERKQVSNLVFYAQSTITVLERLCLHIHLKIQNVSNLVFYAQSTITDLEWLCPHIHMKIQK